MTYRQVLQRTCRQVFQRQEDRSYRRIKKGFGGTKVSWIKREGRDGVEKGGGGGQLSRILYSRTYSVNFLLVRRG